MVGEGGGREIFFFGRKKECRELAKGFERGKSEGGFGRFFFFNSATREPFGVRMCASFCSRLSIDCNNDLDVSSMKFFLVGHQYYSFLILYVNCIMLVYPICLF